jgi:hypothetical protein
LSDIFASEATNQTQWAAFIRRNGLTGFPGDFVAANGNKPPVKSVVLRKRGAVRGIRLINYNSLMQYLAELGST